MFVSALFAATVVRPQSYSGGPLVVEPVFCLASGVRESTEEERQLLVRHLHLAQARYLLLLRGLDTFNMKEQCSILRVSETPAQIQKRPNGAAEYIVRELLKRDHKTRWTTNRIYVVVYLGMGAYPGGGGRPINGGHNQGGGIIILSEDGLKSSNFGSTLQHELGHAFGLPHVDVYGYDMLTNPSIMSYNPAHHTSYFDQSATPGTLIPEDRRGLAENRWAFPKYTFDPAADVPTGYTIKPDVTLGPMDLDGL
ncbi:MAG TPA: hypothetical protein VG820_11865 [Fimbriimonadaceae bacterium]|nr:hypothetical protein [Fimbriimonadaceae bacterium]